MKIQNFEIYESQERNEKFFYKFTGEGIRYELSDFVSMVNGNGKSKIRFKLTEEESIVIASIIERFLKNENIAVMEY